MTPTARAKGRPRVKLAIVILNWNGREHLEKFLPSVVAHSGGAAIVVADNGSKDNSIQFLRENYPQVRVLELFHNRGFAGGYNAALEDVDAEYQLLLNSDVEVTSDWTEPLIALMERYPDVAACQPKVLSYTQKDEFEYAGAAGGFIDSLGYPFCRGRLFDSLENDLGQYDDDCEIFWATGASLLVRADVYREMGGLDTFLFAHMEEIDLCWRMQREGHRIAYCGSSTVYHLGGGTLPQGSPRKTFLNFRNGLILLHKNLPTDRLVKKLVQRMVLDGVAAMRELLAGRGSSFAAIFKAHSAFYRYVWHHRGKTRDGHHRLPMRPTVYDGVLVKDYFLKGKKRFSELGFRTPRL